MVSRAHRTAGAGRAKAARHSPSAVPSRFYKQVVMPGHHATLPSLQTAQLQAHGVQLSASTGLLASPAAGQCKQGSLACGLKQVPAPLAESSLSGTLVQLQR
jgi:hypothetical protein